MKKQSLMKASLILGVAGIIARLLGLLFRWPLIMMIGDEGIGYYQMSYPLYMFFVALATGIPVAMSKMISERKANGNIKGIFQVVKQSTIIMIVLGLGTSFMLFILAKPIISILRWDVKSYYSIIGIAFAPMMISFVTIYRGFFQGLQNMTPSAISQILEQIGRVGVGVGLAMLFLPKGIEYSAGGAAFGAAGGAIICGIYLYFRYRKTRKSMIGSNIKIPINTKVNSELLGIALPISLGATVGTIMGLIDSFLVPQKLLEAGMTAKEATILYAQLTGKANVISNVPLTLSIALATSLIPIIAENYVLKRYKELNSKIEMALKLSSVIAIPCALGLYFLAEPIMRLIFQSRYEGYEILRYSALTIPLIIFTQTTTSILQGVNHIMRPIVNLFVGCIVKVILTIILVPIPSINIYGAVIASIGAYAVAMVLNLISVKSKIGCKMSLYELGVKPLIASLIMIIVVLVTYDIIFIKTTSNGIACLISIFIGGIIYAITAIIIRIFTFDEIRDKVIRK